MIPKDTNKEQEKISERTFIRESEIIWESDRWERLQTIPINEIKIIGQYTTSDGPVADDWFFVFILEKEDIRRISAFATGTDEVLKQVGQKLKTKISRQLANSADWKTNVLWPEILKGQELFKITHKDPKTLWDKLKGKVGIKNQEVELCDNIKEYLS